MAWKGHPTTLYRAVKLPNGQVVCADARVIASTSKVVRSSDEYYKLVGQGWCDHPDKALEMFEQAEQTVSNMAAVRAFEDLRMSEMAQREAEAYEKTVSLQHVPVIPEVSR